MVSCLLTNNSKTAKLVMSLIFPTLVSINLTSLPSPTRASSTFLVMAAVELSILLTVQ